MDESPFEGIYENMPATLILNVKPWKIFRGNVVKISSSHKKKGLARFYEVTVDFPNEDQSLRSGLEGKVSLGIGRRSIPKPIVKWLQKTIRLDLQI